MERSLQDIWMPHGTCFGCGPRMRKACDCAVVPIKTM
jgi:hypothetical protein